MPYTPKGILNRVGDDRILARFHSLSTIYDQQFQKRWPNTFLHKFILRHAVESYFCDLQHSKDFHNIELADQHKVAAFSIKWIVKSRPIQLKTDATPQKPVELLVNEVFALETGLMHLNSDIRNLSAPLIRSLLYTLHHRTIDAETLSAMMYTIECGLNGNKP